MRKKWKVEDIVKDNTVYFVCYRQQYMYYGIDIDDEKLMFPVPLEEKDTLHTEKKATTYECYIRKAIDIGQFIPQTFIAVL